MRLGILGRKVGMTQIFDEAGGTIPVTVIETKDCYITQIKTKQTDGYTAIQLAFGDRKPQNVTKARTGHFKKATVPARAHIQEMRLKDTDDVSQLKAGQKLATTMFAKGDRVDIIAKSKGRGFAGVMKRHNFHGADATHGVHEYFRHAGSAGTNTFPGRIIKNQGMPGHLGDTKTTIPNLEIVGVDEKENLLLIRGAIPGAKTGLVMIRTSKRAKSQPKDRKFTQ